MASHHRDANDAVPSPGLRIAPFPFWEKISAERVDRDIDA